jgi:hypothetical protein
VAEHNSSVSPQQCPRCRELHYKAHETNQAMATAPNRARSGSRSSGKPTGPRSVGDIAEIKAAAGGDTRLSKLIETLSGFTHEACSNKDALMAIAIAQKQIAAPLSRWSMVPRCWLKTELTSLAVRQAGKKFTCQPRLERKRRWTSTHRGKTSPPPMPP